MSNRLGINLNGVTYYTPEVPFLNVMKYMVTWNVVGGSANAADLQTDSNGYPTTMALANGAGTATKIWTSAAGWYNGNYVLLFDGTGDVDMSHYNDGTLVASSPGRQVWNLPNALNNNVTFDINSTDPDNTGDYIRNVRIVYSPDSTGSHVGVNEQALLYGERFNPDFKARFSGMKSLRFMAWQNILNCSTVVWADRTQESYYTYTHVSNDGLPNPAKNIGVPVEVMCALCNELGADPYFNMPFLASRDYRVQFATLAKSLLNSDRTAYVETCGNEIWNAGAILASIWAELNTLGQAAFPGDPVNGFSPAFDYCQLQVALGALDWQSVWTGGDRSRLVCVAGGQNGYQARNEYILGFTAVGGGGSGGGNPALFSGTLASNVDALATAPYFGEAVTDSFTLDQLFQEIMTGGVLVGGYAGGMIKQATDQFSSDKADASAFGKRLIAYESGQSLVPGGDAALRTLYDAAQVDARMGAAYTAYYTAILAICRDLVEVFCSVAGDSNFGDWGLLQNILQTSSPKYDAVEALLAPSLPSAPSVPTGLTARMVSASEADLSWQPSTGEVTGYRVYRNGALIATTTTPSYRDTSLS